MFGTKVNVRSMEDRVQTLEKRPISKGKILFYGDSLFTRCQVEPINHWGNPVLEDSVLGKDGSKVCLNHGFGSSCAEHLLYYYPRLVRPYEPRALVIAVGGNDFGKGYTPQEVMAIVARVVEYFQADFPGAPVYLFSLEPSLRHKGDKTAYRYIRRHYEEVLRVYCSTNPGCRFVPMADQSMFFEKTEDVGDYDKIREDINADDRVHLNAFGYGLFMDFLRELLDDIL